MLLGRICVEVDLLLVGSQKEEGRAMPFASLEEVMQADWHLAWDPEGRGIGWWGQAELLPLLCGKMEISHRRV